MRKAPASETGASTKFRHVREKAAGTDRTRDRCACCATPAGEIHKRPGANPANRITLAA